MENLIDKLLAIPLNYIIICMVASFYILEQLTNTPFKFNKRPLHLFHNIVIQILTSVVSLFFAILQVWCVQWIAHHRIGLFNQVEIPFIIKLVLGVSCIDFTTYWVHRLAHKLPWLWRVHRVHHSDTTMDSSTFFRFHPLEILVFGPAQIIAVAIFGLNPVILGVYFFIQIVFNILQHANILFPS